MDHEPKKLIKEIKRLLDNLLDHSESDDEFRFTQTTNKIHSLLLEAILALSPESINESEDTIKNFSQVFDPENKNIQVDRYIPAIKIPEDQFVTLFREVNEFDLSPRAEKCLKRLGVTYIGDLVHLTEKKILKLKNVGVGTVNTLNSELKELGFYIGMDIQGWPPKDLKKLLKRYSKKIRKDIKQDAVEYRNKLQQEIEYLEDELFYYLASFADGEKYKTIIQKFYGWDGKGKKTLQRVGAEFKITRERVRQIVKMFSNKINWRGRRKQIYLPIMDSAIRQIKASLPDLATYLEMELKNNNISKTAFKLDGILATLEILGRSKPFSLINMAGKEFAVPVGYEKIPKYIFQESRKSVSRSGVAVVSDINSMMSEKFDINLNEDFIRKILSKIDEIKWLDKSKDWYWIPSVPRNRLINIIKKILSVCTAIEITELRSGISRSARMSFAPPRRVLLKFCKQLSFCKVDGKIVTAYPPISWEIELENASNEFFLVSILNENGFAMSREDFEQKCLEIGMSEHSFSIHCSYSPIIAKYAPGVYGLRGAKLAPGTIQSLMPNRGDREKRLIEYGWTSAGEIWTCHKISYSYLKTGIVNIPSPMKQFMQGNFDLISMDGNYIGTFKVKDTSAWSLKKFFKRRGGEEDDYLVLTFNLSSREVRARLGDKDIIDIFTN